MDSSDLGTPAETLIDAADAAGVHSVKEFADFVQDAVSDEYKQELLVRALSIAQDTAMRDKRRALGRALASAVADNGTQVDDELIFIRVLSDLDPFHIRLLRLMTEAPSHLKGTGSPGRGWLLSNISEADPGLANSAWSLMTTLERHGLVWSTSMEDPEYTITGYGESFLTRLADRAASSASAATS